MKLRVIFNVRTLMQLCWHERKNSVMALTFAATHEQQFSLLQNYGIGDLSHWNKHNKFYLRRALCGVALTCWRIKLREIPFVWVHETTLARSPIPLEWGSGSGSWRMVANAEPALYRDGIFQLMPCVGKSALMCWGIMLESNGTTMEWIKII